MPTPDHRDPIDATDAKAASNEGVMRWVLGISLALAIIALTVIWVTGALTQDPVESQMNVERREEAVREQGVGADSMADGITVDDPDAGAPKTSGER